MKRPMLFCGFCSLMFSCLAFSLLREIIVLFIALFVVLTIVSLIIKRLRFLFVAFAICILVLFSCFLAVNDAKSATSFDGKVKLSGTVCDVIAYENGVSYTVKLSSIDSNEQNFKIRLSSMYSLNLDVGDKIAAKVKLDSELPNSYLLSKRIYRKAELVKLYSHIKQSDINAKIYEAREKISDFFLNELNAREASLLLGLTTGDTGYIDDELYDNVRRSGASHIVVVSGLHLSIIAGGFMSLAKHIKMPLKTAGFLGLLLLALIVAVTGFTVSAMRAALTFVILFFGYFLGRKPDALNSLFTAITILCIENPFVAGSVSFQLSSAATFGIIVLSPVAIWHTTSKMDDGIAERAVKGILSVLFTSLSATILTLPFTIWHFGVFSLVAIITNIAITVPVTVALLLSVISILFNNFPFVYKFTLLLSGLLAKGILFVIESFGKMPYAAIELKNPLLFTIISAAFAAFVSIYCLKNIDKRKCASSDAFDRTRIKKEY